MYPKGFIGFNHAPTKIITSNAQRMIPYSFQKQINMLSKSPTLYWYKKMLLIHQEEHISLWI